MIDLLKNNQELWDLFTAKEEYDAVSLDKHQRFVASFSKNKNIDTPIVSNFLVKNGLNVLYPNDKKFAVCLTHDIDGFNSFPKVKMAKEGLVALSQLKFGLFFQKFLLGLRLHRIGTRVWKKSINPLYNFEAIMDLEAKYSAKSSFYFLAIDESDKDFDYSLDEISEQLKDIVKNGWEVGLHGSRQASCDLSVLKSEKNKLEQVLGQKIVGYRNHYLMFKVPQTWENLQEAGFSYDTTFGYADMPGFRNGMCYPFKPYNLKKNNFMNIWEFPLIVMDRTLDHMGLNKAESLILVKTMIDKACECGGVLTLLWHNTELTKDKISFYEEILKYAQSKNAWLTSGENIQKWADENLAKAWEK